MNQTSKPHSRGDDAAPILLRLLGPVELSVGGTRVTGVGRKTLAMLAYLARRTDAPVTRETLRGLLWADSAEDQSRASLRQALSALRKALGPAGDAIESEGEALRLRRETLDLDTGAFDSAAAAEDTDTLEAAAALYRGAFLEGFGSAAPEFDRWAAAERAALESTFAAILLRLTDAYEAEGRTEKMIATAQRLLTLDPLREHVHRRLIRAYHAQRRHDAALRQFADLEALLDRDLGVAPEPQTIDLIRKVRADRSGGSNPAPALARAQPVAPDRPSIAVLPFRALSDNPDAVFFGEGIAEDTITELAREPGLMVVARHSSFRFDERQESAEQIGQSLGVRFLLNGSVRMAGDRVRIAAHLTRCDTGQEVWAERFDRDLADIFAIQTEIARTVTMTVIGQIAEVDTAETFARPVETLESYALILRGLRHMQSLTPEDFDAAIGFFRRALEISPDSARALGLLSLAGIYRRWYFDIATDMADLAPEAERAVALDPRDAKGHCALGIVHMLGRNFDRARHHFEAGRAANPNDEQILIEYGRFLMYDARAEDGLQMIREAMRLNPYHPAWYWNMEGRCLHTLGRLEEAVERFRRIPAPPFYVHAYLAACLTRLGRTAEAEEERRAVFAGKPDFDLGAFAEIFPYKTPETLAAYLEDFRAAGLDRPPG